MLKICLVFWESEPRYAYKYYAYKKTCIIFASLLPFGIKSNFKSSITFLIIFYKKHFIA